MAVIVSTNCYHPFPVFTQSRKPNFTTPEIQPLNLAQYKFPHLSRIRLQSNKIRNPSLIVSELRSDSEKDNPQGSEESLGVKAALSVLRFYKGEISPLLPKSCRYVPTCSEYSMEAYKKYGFGKGSMLTAWRICRCNPLGGSGFDPPRWFDEKKLHEE